MTASTNDNTPSPGLLPTARVELGPPADKDHPNSHGMEDGGSYSSPKAGHHTAYFDNWNRERQAALARGEDPNAKFLALQAAREEKTVSGKLRRWMKGLRGDQGHGERLTKEEEKEAMAKDKERGKEDAVR